MGKYLLVWFPMVAIAILNGMARQYVYGGRLSELQAHQISTLTGILLFGLYMWGLFQRWPADSSRQALSIGLLWLAMTIAFEFLFGHYAAGHSWSRLLQDYDLLSGRLWTLVLLWTGIGPYLIHRLRGRGP